MSVGTSWYLTFAAMLFTIGAVGLLVRRNVLVMFMCVELMLNAANLTFVTFARELNDIAGQAAVFFVLVVAAAEVVVGLGIIVAIFRRRPGATADDVHSAEGLTAPMLTSVFLDPAVPARRLLVLARRSAESSATRVAGWLATAGGGGLVRRPIVVFVGLFRLPADSRSLHPDLVHLVHRRPPARRRRACSSTRCR